VNGHCDKESNVARLQQEDRRCGVFILLLINKLVTDIPNVQYDVHRPEN
jgi:hypothetical protein